ncbi:MAG: sugar phosphate isomerase/epimerase [Gemmatimonadetes bacterium]|nr:sugar phosphate isomerase/epimerase [Gemmatimonadota bacterium]
MDRFKFGILEDVIQSDWVNVFPRAKALGYDGVELGVRANTYRASDLWSDETIEILGERAESAGIPVFSVCLHTFWRYTFADPDVANRFMAKQIVFQAIHACNVLGIGTILIPVTNPLGLPPCEAAHRWAYETRAVASQAAGQGIRIGLENVGRSHVVTGEQMMELIEAVDNPYVGAYFDVGNAQMLGSNSVADIHCLADRIVQVHIKDPRTDRTPCYVGEGEIDLEGCLKALVDVEYAGPLVFETPPMEDALSTAERNLRTLKSLVESVVVESGGSADS